MNKQGRVITFDDWLTLDAFEKQQVLLCSPLRVAASASWPSYSLPQGAKVGKPREKIVVIEDMLRMAKSLP